MKISIITVCYNAATTIKESLDSVRGQTFSGIEQVLVDGGSTDGTLDIIDVCQDSSVKLISEPDEGIFDAMNKGIALATGDIVGILNADDVYANKHILGKVAAAFNDPEVDACYGDLVYVKKLNLNKIVRFWSAGTYQQGAFSKGWCPPHPTFFVRRSLYEKYGKFDLNFGLAADFELMLRYIEKKRVNTTYIPSVMVRMRLGGASNKSLRNILAQNKKIILAFKVNQIDFSIPIFLTKKIFKRLKQFCLRNPNNATQ